MVKQEAEMLLHCSSRHCYGDFIEEMSVRRVPRATL